MVTPEVDNRGRRPRWMMETRTAIPALDLEVMVLSPMPGCCASIAVPNKRTSWDGKRETLPLSESLSTSTESTRDCTRGSSFCIRSPRTLATTERVRSLPASPAAEHRGRVWEPSQGFHDSDSLESHHAAQQSAAGEIYVLEVNPLPGLTPGYSD